MTRTLLSAAAIVLVAGCATAPKPDVATTPPQSQAQPAQAPPTSTTPAGAFDPVGTYDFTANLQGQAITGTMTITKGENGVLGGTMSSSQGGVRLNNVSLEGRKMTATGTIETGPEIYFVINFEGDAFNGTFDVQGTSGTVAGTKRKD